MTEHEAERNRVEVTTASRIRMWYLTAFADYEVLNRRLRPISGRFSSMKYIRTWHLAKRDRVQRLRG